MTIFEMFTSVITLGMFVIALLTYIDRKNQRK